MGRMACHLRLVRTPLAGRAVGAGPAVGLAVEELLDDRRVGRENGTHGMQHLLCRASWDADAVRDDVREYVVEHLHDEAAVLIVDETTT